MKTLKAIVALCCLAAIGADMAAVKMNADPWNKKTIITITEPMQIPGAVLTPGKYVFKLVDSASNRHIVQVFDEDEKNVINTILAIPNRRLQPTGKSEFGFWEVPAGNTPALRSWFYPGDNMGQEFAYPKQEATKLSAMVKEEVPSLSEEEYAQATTVTPAPQEAAAEVKTPEPQPATPAPEVAVAETPKPVEAPVAVQEPPAPQAPATTTPVDRPREEVPADDNLPSTASPLPLLGLLGLLFTGLGAAVRTLRSRNR